MSLRASQTATTGSVISSARALGRRSVAELDAREPRIDRAVLRVEAQLRRQPESGAFVLRDPQRCGWQRLGVLAKMLLLVPGEALRVQFADERLAFEAGQAVR